MSHSGDAPHQYRQRKTLASSQSVDQFPDEKQSGAVGELESQDDVAITNFRPTELELQGGFQQPDHLPVHVIH